MIRHPFPSLTNTPTYRNRVTAGQTRNYAWPGMIGGVCSITTSEMAGPAIESGKSDRPKQAIRMTPPTNTPPT